MRAIAHTNGSFDFKQKEKEKQRLACSIARQSYVQADRRCRKNNTSTKNSKQSSDHGKGLVRTPSRGTANASKSWWILCGKRQDSGLHH